MVTTNRKQRGGAAWTRFTFVPPERLLSRLGGGFLLAYHNLPVERFVEQVESYAGLNILPLSEMVARLRSGRSTAGCLAITVDDGVASTVRALSQVAADRQWPITFYLPTQYLDEPLSPIHMLWTNIRHRLPLGTIRISSGTYDLSDPRRRAEFAEVTEARLKTKPLSEHEGEIRELRDSLAESGVATFQELDPAPPITWDEVASYSRNALLDFQSHGVTHRAMSALSSDDIEAEFKLSQKKLQDATGRPCRHFAYPFGGPESIGAEAPRLAAKYYDSAVTMTRGRVKGSDPLLLPRIPLYGKDSPARARIKVLTA